MPDTRQPGALPAFFELAAQPSWRAIDFISDLHLSEALPRTFQAFEAHLNNTAADAVFILGDLFEAWVGDDMALHGFERLCVQAMAHAASRRQLAFMVGNRDFLAGTELLRQSRAIGLPDPTVLSAWGQRVLLSHGDALCLADTAYQQFRQQVRSAAWQQGFLARPLAARQQQARAMRDASAAHQATMPPGPWADVDAAAASAWLEAADAQVLIHGHTHRPAMHGLPGGRSRQVLGDWDFDSLPHRARLLRLSQAGLQSLDLADPAGSNCPVP